MTIDVKSAFLYAPIGAEAKGRDERIIVKPPTLFTELGKLKASGRWWVKKALYGLPTSPKDWGTYGIRSLGISSLKWECKGMCFVNLNQTNHSGSFGARVMRGWELSLGCWWCM